MKKNSLSGTSTTKADKTALSVDEICRIIELCGRTGVAELKFGGLQVRLVHTVPFLRPEEPAPETVPTSAPDTAISAQVEKDALVEAELELREDQLHRLAIEDPVEYERMKLSGDIVDAEDEDC